MGAPPAPLLLEDDEDATDEDDTAEDDTAEDAFDDDDALPRPPAPPVPAFSAALQPSAAAKTATRTNRSRFIMVPRLWVGGGSDATRDRGVAPRKARSVRPRHASAQMHTL